MTAKISFSPCAFLFLALLSVLSASFLASGVTVGFSALPRLLVFLGTYLAARILFSVDFKVMERWTLVAAESLCIFECVLGLLQMVGIARSNHGLFLITGTFMNPGPFGGLVGMIGVIAAVHGWRHRDALSGEGLRRPGNWPIMLSLVTVALAVTVLPASMSRAAWLSVAVALLVFASAELELKVWIRRHRMLSLTGAVVGVVLLAGVFAFKRDSAVGRLHIWHMELRAVTDHPLLGVGPGNEMGAYGTAQERYFRSKPRSSVELQAAGCPEYAFNEYLKFGMQGGVFCLFFVVALAVVSVSTLLKSGSVLAYGMTAFSVFAFFSYPLSCFPLVLLLAVFIAAAGSVSGRAAETGKGFEAKSAAPLVPVVLLLCLAIFSITFFNGTRYKAYRNALSEWESSQHLRVMEMYADQVEVLVPLYNSLQSDMHYLYDYGYALYKTDRYAESNTVLSEGASISCDPMFHNIMGKNWEAMGWYDKAEEEYLRAHYMVPGRLYPYILLMEMASRRGDMESAAGYARSVLALPVNGRNLTMVELHERADTCLTGLLERSGRQKLLKVEPVPERK